MVVGFLGCYGSLKEATSFLCCYVIIGISLIGKLTTEKLSLLEYKRFAFSPKANIAVNCN